MKTLGFLVICLVVTFINAQSRGTKYFNTLHERCATEMGYSQETYAEIRKTQDARLGCLSLCALKKTGDWINNQIDKAHAINTAKGLSEKTFTEESSKKVGNCVDEANKSNTDCGKGLEYSKCLLKLMK